MADTKPSKLNFFLEKSSGGKQEVANGFLDKDFTHRSSQQSVCLNSGELYHGGQSSMANSFYRLNGTSVYSIEDIYSISNKKYANMFGRDKIRTTSEQTQQAFNSTSPIKCELNPNLRMTTNPSYKVYNDHLSGIPSFNQSFESTDSISNHHHYNSNTKKLLRAASCNNSITTINALSKVDKPLYSSNNLGSQCKILTGNANSTSHINVNNEPGFLRRSLGGQSNQSLCSCEAGAETEFQNDPTKPLYRYNLEKTTSTLKRHTYTCEQNAQILMRLERERAQCKDHHINDAIKRVDNKIDSEVCNEKRI